jgi:hypothetical protein
MLCDALLDFLPVVDAPGICLARAAGEVADESLVRLLVEALQLGERLGVIVDAQVEVLDILLWKKSIELRTACRACRRPPAWPASRAAMSFSGKWTSRSGKGLCGVSNDVFIGEHVSGHRKPRRRRSRLPIQCIACR